MTKEQKSYIKLAAKYVRKYAHMYGITVHSAVIAQAILESDWGRSSLALRYCNHFGLKCGTLWKGKSVDMATYEEFEPGTMVRIVDYFRVYASMKKGFRGYFEFLDALSRYDNLKGIRDPRTYLETIIADGYATDRAYVSKCMQLVEECNLTKYDPEPVAPDPVEPEEEARAGVTAQEVIDLARSYLGAATGGATQRGIVDVYNGHRPLARGYVVQYTDSWCAVFVSFLFISLEAVDLIGGTECGVDRFIEDVFRPQGIWTEDGKVVPLPGDIITFNWDQRSQPNDGFADHIGIVCSVTDGTICTIEGNAGGRVQYRYYSVGDGQIRGYARPGYSKASTGAARPQALRPVSEIASEVIAGKWGNGDDRRARLTAAGYDYDEVQAAVNKALG